LLQQQQRCGGTGTDRWLRQRRGSPLRFCVCTSRSWPPLVVSRAVRGALTAVPALLSLE